MSEYNHPAPNDYQVECVPMVAVMAAAQDWDGVWFFAYSHRPDVLNRECFKGFFDIDANPAKWGFMRAGAAIFRDGALKGGRDARIVPLAAAEGDIGALGRLQARYEHDLFRIAAEADKLTWSQLLTTKMSVSLWGTRFAASSAGGSEDAAGTLVAWSPGKAFAASGPQACVWVGRPAAGADGLVQLKDPAFGAVTLTALDGLPFARSARLLITACGRCENTQMGFSPDRRTVGTTWGQPPVRIEPLNATLRLPRLAAGRWQCEALGPDGRSRGQRPVDPAKPFELSARDKTMWYLLSRE